MFKLWWMNELELEYFTFLSVYYSNFTFERVEKVSQLIVPAVEVLIRVYLNIMIYDSEKHRITYHRNRNVLLSR